MKTFFIVSLVIFKFIVSISSVALHKSDHSHENLPKEDFFINKIYEKFSNENVNFSLISIGDFGIIYDKLGIHIHNHDLKSVETCYAVDDLFDIFHVHNKSSLISKSDFMQMFSPALVLMAMECDHEHIDSKQSDTHENLPGSDFFLNQIFISYSSQSSNYSFLTIKEFKMMYEKLGIHVNDDHNHSHSSKVIKDTEFGSCYSVEDFFDIFHVHNKQANVTKKKFVQMSHALIWMAMECTRHDHKHLPEPDFFINQIFQKYSNATLNYSLISFNDFVKIYSELKIHADEHDHGNEHRIIKRIDRRQVSFKEELESCFHVEDLFEIFHVHDKNALISKEKFIEMSPSLVWMGMECGEHDHGHNQKNCIDRKDAFLFGSISIIVIWLLSFVSVFIVGKLNTGGRTLLVIALRALAIGTLLSDSLLHIIPSALGLHDHGSEEEGQDYSHSHGDKIERDKNDPIWKMTVTMATIFGLWMLESFMHHQHHDDMLDIHEHSHSHGHQNENGNKQQVNKLDYDNLTPSASTSSSAATVKSEDKNFRIEDISTVPIKKSTTKSGFLNLKQIQSTGWVAFIGDILHKAADGFAIGASFAESLSLGFSTSLAILFHEIPHELGDYAVLLGAGFKFWNILVLNTITSFTSWVAFMIISSVSPSVLIREYIFAVITGVFIYIALANMIPKMGILFIKVNGKRNKKEIAIVLLFFFVGWITMLLLALFEEEIRIDIKSDC